MSNRLPITVCQIVRFSSKALTFGLSSAILIGCSASAPIRVAVSETREHNSGPADMEQPALTVLRLPTTSAILKLSYNKSGDAQMVGGICGSAFFISSDTAITAEHVLSVRNFAPNTGYRYCQYWLISADGTATPIYKTDIKPFPNRDVSLIHLRTRSDLPSFRLAKQPVQSGAPIVVRGYTGGVMPKVDASWNEDSLVLTHASLPHYREQAGHIEDIRLARIDTSDVRLHDVKVLVCSFGGCQGMSGSPVLDQSTGEVIGVLSFGIPIDAVEKAVIYAIPIDEVRNILASSGISPIYH